MRMRLPAISTGRWGWPGAAGVIVALATAVFHAWAVWPAEQHVLALHERAVALETRAARGPDPAAVARTPAEQLAAFYRAFPAERSSPDWIGKIADTAKRSGLSLDQGEYRPAPTTVGRLTRVEITLPVRGGYRQIREFLARTGENVPTAALEQVQFARQKVGDAEVDARIRLVLYLEQAS